MQLALDLINSEWWYGRGADRLVDQLDEPGWVDDFLVRWKFTAAGPPTERDKSRLVRLRTLLRSVFTRLAEGDGVAAEDLEDLNRFAGRSVLHRRVVADGSYRVEVVPARTDWSWVLAEVAASFGELLAHGERGRIKQCENAECRWAFYDESKNRRRRWCDPAQCGNVYKVRQFRARQRGDAAAASR
jgi:predicted RNA-binding Zn ribbon-like protein